MASADKLAGGAIVKRVSSSSWSRGNAVSPNRLVNQSLVCLSIRLRIVRVLHERRLSARNLSSSLARSPIVRLRNNRDNWDASADGAINLFGRGAAALGRPNERAQLSSRSYCLVSGRQRATRAGEFLRLDCVWACGGGCKRSAAIAIKLQRGRRSGSTAPLINGRASRTKRRANSGQNRNVAPSRIFKLWRLFLAWPFRPPARNTFFPGARNQFRRSALRAAEAPHRPAPRANWPTRRRARRPRQTPSQLEPRGTARLSLSADWARVNWANWTRVAETGAAR